MRPVIPYRELSEPEGGRNAAALITIAIGVLTAIVMVMTVLVGPQLFRWWAAAGTAAPITAVTVVVRPPSSGRPGASGLVSENALADLAVARGQQAALRGGPSAGGPVEVIEACKTFALAYSAGFQVSGCLPTPDGSLVAVRLWQPSRHPIPERIGVWDTATGAKRGEWDTGTLAGWLHFSADGARLSGFDNSRRVWSEFSFPDGRVLRRVDLRAQFPSRFSAWAFFDDDAEVAILDPDAAVVRVYDIRAGGRLLRQFPVIVTSHLDMTASADGRTLALWPSAGDPAVRFYDLNAGTLSATQTVNPGGWERHFVAGGTQLLEVPDRGLALVDVRTGSIIASTRAGEVWWGTKVSASGDAALRGTGPQWLDLQAPSLTVWLVVHGTRACSNNSGISDDGRHVAAVIDNGPCAVWDLSKSHPKR
jgi:WD40 repeat protein